MIVEIKRKFHFNSVGFRFDAMAAFLMCQQHGVDLNEMNKIPKTEYTPSWVWSAHRSYCMIAYKKPMPYNKMKHYIDNMRKSEWDILIAAMMSVKTPEGGDKKKAQAGMNSSSQDGKQE